jgi:transketolase
MTFINDRNIKMWSTIGPRATFGMAALELAKNQKDLMVLTCDVSTSAGLDRFRKTFPDKYIDLGIAEQNMIGVAAGLATEKFKVITTTFAPFQTMRCCEQIKVNAGYMKKKICMVGIASGLVLGPLGFTHCCIEDIGVLRSIPGLTIVSPADTLETVKAINQAIELNSPSYIRLTGGSNNPMVNNKDYTFKIGKSIELIKGEDLVIFSSGSMVYTSLQVAKALKSKKISCRVVNMHTIKPIDQEAIEKSLNLKLIVSLEEHNIIGGLGSAIAEHKSKFSKSPKQLFLGIKDVYGKGGTYSYLKDIHRLTTEKIVEDIILNL